MIREIEIVITRGSTVRPIAPTSCSASRGGEPCGRAARHGFDIGARLVPVCLRDIARAEKAGGLAFVNGGGAA